MHNIYIYIHILYIYIFTFHNSLNVMYVCVYLKMNVYITVCIINIRQS